MKDYSPETVTPRILPDIDSFVARTSKTAFALAELRPLDVRILRVRQDRRVDELASRASHHLVSPRFNFIFVTKSSTIFKNFLLLD